MVNDQNWDVQQGAASLEAEGPWDMPVVTVEAKSNRQRSEEAMLVTAAESSYTDITDSTEAFKLNYERLAMQDAELIAKQISGNYVEDEMAAADELMPTSPDLAMEYKALRTQELQAPDALHRMALETISQEDDMFTQAEVANSYAAYRVNDMLEKTSKGEDVANFLSDVFLPVASKDRGDFLTNVFGEELDLSFREAVVDFASRSPQDRAAMYPALEAAALDATDGNEARAARLLQELYGITEEDTTFDAIMDASIIGPALFTGMVKATKAGGFVYRAAKLNKKLAGEVMAGAAKNADIAEATGITQRTVAESTSPFRWSDVSVDAIDGIEAEVVKAFDDGVAEVQAAIRETEEGLIKRSPLTEAEQKAAQVKALAEFDTKSAKLNKENGWAASNARITATDEYGFTVEYDLLDATGKPLNAKPQQVFYTKNDVGEYDSFTVGGIESRLNSPSVWANRAQANVVELATAIGFSNERTLAKLMGTANDAIKGMKKESILKMDQVLIKGDEFKDVTGKVVGKVYTPKELMLDGIPGVGRLTAKEAEGYYKMRAFWDDVHRISDQQVLRQWRFEGTQTVGKFNGERVYGTVVQPSQVPKVNTVMDLGTNQVVDYAAIQTRIERGELQVVKFRRNIDLGDEIYEYGVIPKNSAKALPSSGVLPKKNGYVPLIRKDAYYFVESAATKMINGRKGTVPTVVRAFDNQTDAVRWAAEEEARTGIKHTSRYDREVGGDIKSDLQQSQFGKPIFGSRVDDREILFGYNGTKPERLDPMEALQRNINSISNSMPMNEFRMAQLKKWQNSAAKWLNDPSDINSGFKASSANKEVESLKAMKRWLDDQFHIKTESEQVWAGTMRGFSEFLEGSKFFKEGSGAGVRKGLQEAAGTDPFGVMRGASFHMLLGWWNPAQMLVQGMGATLAISLNPVKFPKIMSEYQMLRAGYNAGDDSIRAMAKVMGRDADEMVALRNAYKRTGLVESLKTTADYNAASLGYGIDAGAVQRAFGKASDSSLVFFREGERFNRSYSWLLAADDYMALNKMKASALKDADIDLITQQSLKYTMNMNRANRAEWQKGVLSIPTQFWQVNAKFFETVAPRILGSNGALTNSQKARVMLGQTALFGAAGVPLGNALLNGFLEYSGVQMGDLDENQIAGLRQGLTGAALQAIIGEEVEVAERFAFGSGFNQLMETFINGEKTFGEIMAGAPGAVPTRIFAALDAIAPRFAEPELSMSEGMAIGNELASVVSTWRNAHKAYMFAKLGEIRTADGTLVDYTDWGEDFKMIVAQGLGFAPSRVAEYYDHKTYQRNMATIRSDVLRSLEKNYVQFLSGDVKDPQWQARYQQLNSLLMNSVEGPMEQEKVREAWAKKLTQDPQLQKLMGSTIETYFGSGVSQPKTIGPGIPLSTFKEVAQ